MTSQPYNLISSLPPQNPYISPRIVRDAWVIRGCQYGKDSAASLSSDGAKIGLKMGANPYLSVFVKIISKFLIFNAFKPHIIRNFLAKQEKICYL